MMRGDILQASYHQLVPHRQVLIQEIMQRKGRRGSLVSGSFLFITPSKRKLPRKREGRSSPRASSLDILMHLECSWPF